MRHTALMLLPLLLSITCTPVYAFNNGPACREPSVVDEITREIKAQNYYSRVDPSLVTEQGTSQANIVLCQVCVESETYNGLSAHDQPRHQCLARGFEVRIVTNGFVVRDLW